MSVKRAQAEIDSREFAEWMALEGMEPWSQYRDDLRIGYLGAILAGIMGGGKHKPEDFMPDFEPEEKPRDVVLNLDEESGRKRRNNLAAMHDIVAKRFGERARNPDGTQWKPDNG